MKRKNQKKLFIGAGLILMFILWTVLVQNVDVRAIGPNGSSVGFSTVNGFIHNLTGENMNLYVITDWLGLVPIFIIMGFGILGLIEWIKRKSILKVDFSILALGVFYIIVMAVYIFFEMYVVNYRPVLINGFLEASYPSSTTVLVMCVIPTAVMQFNSRIKNNLLRRCVAIGLYAFAVFMVVGRMISGVHWISDIIGGLLFSIGIVMLYNYVTD